MQFESIHVEIHYFEAQQFAIRILTPHNEITLLLSMHSSIISDPR